MNDKAITNLDGKIGLFTTSYPPQVDGVANVVWNYSQYLEKNHEGAVIFAPKIKQQTEIQGRSPVARYFSIDTMNWLGYPAGLPMSPDIAREMNKNPISLMHMHDPFVSVMIGRELKNLYNLPMVLTYHTTFDIDIKEFAKPKWWADFWINVVRENAAACDEVWVVSHGAEKNLRSIGYEGETFLMPNGVDMPHHKAPDDIIHKYCGDLPTQIPVLLFVGRMIKTKGILQIISALKILNEKDIDFRMVFIGDGRDFDSLKIKAKEAGVYEKCRFLGRILDRKILHAWYTRSDLFLFPSESDTQGLVVTEAAAVGTPSLMIRGSFAADPILDDINGFLTENTPESIADRTIQILKNPVHREEVGKRASEDLYCSWEDAVERAYERYQIVIDQYKCGKYTKQKKIPGDRVYKAQAAYMALGAKLFK